MQDTSPCDTQPWVWWWSQTDQLDSRKVESIGPLQSYYLDLSTLLQILSRQKRSGRLSVDNIHVPSFKGNVSVVIEIEHGVVRNCQVMQRRVVVATGQSAIQVLMTLQPGEWHWSSASVPPGQSSALQPSSVERTTQPLSYKPAPTAIPRQTSLAQDPKILNRLSRQHRRVLALIDGNRTPSQMASILAMSTAELSRHISDLEQWGLVSQRVVRENG